MVFNLGAKIINITGNSFLSLYLTPRSMIESDKFSRKEQIEKEACRLFKAKGYPATSMRDIAHATGIEAASLYSHIKSKEEILQTVCFRMADKLFEVLDKIEALNLTPGNQLEKAMIAHVEVINEDPDAAAVALDEWKHLTGDNLVNFIEIRENYEQRWQNIIHDGVKAGEFKAFEPKLIMLTLLASINWTHNWYNPRGYLSASDLGKQLSEIFIKGLHS